MMKITLGTAQGQHVGWASAPGGNVGQGRQKCGLKRRGVTCQYRPAAGGARVREEEPETEHKGLEE